MPLSPSRRHLFRSLASAACLAAAMAAPQALAQAKVTRLLVAFPPGGPVDFVARTLAEQTIELGGQQVPINFQLTVDRDLLGKKARITLAARIAVHGKLLFINDTAYPVKIEAGKGHVDMQLRQVSASRKP